MEIITSYKRHHYLSAAASALLVTVVLIAGLPGCNGGYPRSLDLIVSSTAGGNVTAPGEGAFAYDEGAVVNLAAEAEEGYYFAKWTGDVETVGDADAIETTITMNDNFSITANFVPDGAEPVWDWYDLDAVRDNLGGAYVLMNDLDSITPGYEELASPTANGGKGWEPIGTKDDPFTGTFDGQGYEIGDLRIDRPEESRVGLFGRVGEGGNIEDIGVVDANVTGQTLVGVLAGYNQGHVNNSYSAGSIAGVAIVGGLAGHNDGPVSASHFIGNVTSDQIVGGLVGGNGFSSVSDSYAEGNVSGRQIVGGLLGVNLGSVSDSHFTGSVTGEEIVGGLIGESEESVSNSYSTGSVTGTDDVGGLMGGNSGTISNCYSTGIVNGGRYAGGLVGGNGGNVTNCYSAGSVAGSDDVGGLVGDDRYGNVTNSFWDVETSGQATSDGGTGKNTTEMLDFTTFSVVGWNITTVVNPATRNTSYIWNIVDDETYAFLSWQS